MTMDGDLITRHIKSLEEESESIDGQIFDIALYSNGGMPIVDAKMLSFTERDKVIQRINKKLSDMSGTEWM